MFCRNTSSRLDAELLACHVCGCDRAAIYRDPNTPVTATQHKRFMQLAKHRAGGQPMAQIIGNTEFWSLSFAVDTNVLIPRSDTETLVETALDLIPTTGEPVIADLGTGTGAIAVVFATERPQATVLATDLSAQALHVASRNCRAHRASRVVLAQANWMTAFAEIKFDFIVSNPPYIECDDPLLANTDIRFEPRNALVAGPDGLDDLRVIVKQAPRHLKQGGYLLVEHGYNQASQVRQLFAERGFQRTTTQRDIGNRERVTFGRKA